MNKYGQVRVSTGSKYGFLCVVTVSIEMIYINKYDKYGVLLINYINKKYSFRGDYIGMTRHYRT